VVRHNERLSAGDMVLWGSLGLATGLVAGVALGGWVGDVNRPRIERAARRLREPAPDRPTSQADMARQARAALGAEATLGALSLDASAVARGVVELRGWVPSRAARALAARTVRAVPGVESVINSILVRGEDDRTSGAGAATERPA
jgi:hypothetical protein